MNNRKKFFLLGIYFIIVICFFGLPFHIKVNSKEKPTEIILVKGHTTTFNTTGDIKWKSSNPKIVTINQKGVVTAKEEGDAIITGKISNYTFYYHFIVEDPKINYENLTLEIGKRKRLIVKGTNAKLKWQMTNNGVVRINQKGTVTALAKGRVILYTYVHNAVFQCEIEVKEPSLAKAIQTGNTKYLTKVNKKIVKKARKVIKQQIKPNMTQVEEVKAIHDYLVLHTAYDYENYQKDTIPSSSYSPEGVLLYGSGVCQGYAETFLLFMEVLEIPCQIISGKENGEAHAWNIVKIEGKWYQIDVTWDDPVPDIPEKVKYNYFLIPDKIMRENHTWNSSDYPTCTSWDYVYYMDQEYIVDSIDQFRTKFLEQFQQGKNSITVMYPENDYPDWDFIWDYSKDWNYYKLEKKGDYYVITINILDR